MVKKQLKKKISANNNPARNVYSLLFIYPIEIMNEMSARKNNRKRREIYFYTYDS